MTADDPLDELTEAISDGAPIDWDREETRGASRSLEGEVRALRDVARIAEFNRGLQHATPSGTSGALDAPTSSSQWGHFTLLERAGTGAHGEVWRAWDPSLHREVAVKFIHAQDAATEGANQAIFDEARALARVRHPGVAAVHGVAEFGGRVGMWMEYLRGPTLAARIQERGALPWQEVARIGRDLCSALDALDHAGLVHRDIKPANVVLETGGRVVLADFGLGWRRRIIETDAPRPGSGTPLFMAPSLLAGGPPTPRTDLYALGVTLLWALDGRAPFQARTLDQLKAESLHGPERRHPGANRDAPAGLIEALEGCARESEGGVRLTAERVRARLQALLDDSGGDPGASVRAPWSERGSSAGDPSIAVLPFLNRSGEPSDEYFSDGLADEMVIVLSKIRGLRVAARTSSFQFKGKNEDLGVVGEKLKVATILEGSVRKSGGRVRISARLVKVPEGDSLWSEIYDRSLEDIFAVQDDIARCVVTELRRALLGEESTTTGTGGADATTEVAVAVRGRGQDPEAHRLLLQGRHLLDSVTPDDTAKAIESLKRAVTRDPAYSLGWSALGRAYTMEADFGWAPVGEGTRRARQAIERALELDPELTFAHGQLAWLRMHYDRDWRGAEASVRRAVELDPNDAVVLRRAGALTMILDRPEEAIGFYSRALERDPLSTVTYNNLAYAYYVADRLPDAERAYRKSLDLAPGRIGARAQLALVLSGQGRREEALAEAMREPQEVYRIWALALIHTAEGHEADSRRALAELTEKYGKDGAFQIAQIHAARREADAAFEWLETAYRQQDAGLASLRATPPFRALAADTRWAGFLLKMGFDVQ